ncbi:carbamate kinase [Cellulomonas wangsupingiae]|uniref:Carbamate kinase n=1 Tax=Cellulomonas wangsupingiae TaxID=2968085 RepID=A0ABY5K9B5_9CELL|nr:carbamate kinase [Cellulomonas wangsupingiae]MCC2335340.1 carbamate kinase [Cellulomonas wangsupingiae]UUI66525.1 carbamate kinase [Cellulomonas wangsupingiae]
MTGTVLLAVGGNALVLDGEPGSVARQQERAARFADQVADLVGDGRQVLVTHGNGPQVGFILRRGELVAPDASVEGLPELPLWLAVADSQGGIGHLLAVAVDSALERRGLDSRAVAVLTHVEVDADDPAFALPTKPIGAAMTSSTARARTAEGWTVIETAPGVHRRVVPSPRPRRVVEAEQIRALVHTGAVVVAAGGGGIPVVRAADGWHGVDAVVDKDRASALLAASVGVDTLVLVTGVDEVSVGRGTPRQRALREVDPVELRAHLDAGEFPPGSMGPKVESALQFVADGGRRAVITSLPRLRDALEGRSGTLLTARDRPAPPTPTALSPASTPGEPMITLAADPFPYVFDPRRVALLCIDFQRDFMEAGGFGESLGNDVSRLRGAIEPTSRVLEVFRDRGWPVIHTREGHRPDLTDLFPAKRDRGSPTLRIGEDGPMGRVLVRGSAGHGIVPELAPVEGEVVLDKPGKGSFYATDLETILRARGITSLVVTGVTTEVCVQTTVREANDRGFESLVLSDCTASYFPQFHRSALDMFCAQGGIVGWVATSDALLTALRTTTHEEVPR